MDKSVANLQIDQGPSRFCLICGYELRGLAVPRCPECGQSFDPANSRTFRCKPLLHWSPHLKQFAVAMFTIVFLLAIVWGWFYWGWYSEQKLIEASGADNVQYGSIVLSWIGDQITPAPPISATMGGEMVNTSWIRNHAGPAGFVLDRVVGVYLKDDVINLAPVAGFKRLKVLGLGKSRGINLSPLSDTKSIEELYLSETDVVDLKPLAGLTRLKILDLSETKVADLTPLTELTSLEDLNLCDTRVTDISPLFKFKSLRRIQLCKTKVSFQQIEELKQALPRCTVIYQQE